MRSCINISHISRFGKNSNYASKQCGNCHKTITFPSNHNLDSHHTLVSRPKGSKLTDKNQSSQSLSELSPSRTITVLISFIKLSQYDDEWLKLGKQLLLHRRVSNKERFYRTALDCFNSAIKKHPDNYLAYYFKGITLCLLKEYEESVRMFDYSLRYNKEESNTLLYILSEMLSIIEGIRIATGGDGVNGINNISASAQQGTLSNNSYLAFIKNLDK